MAVRYIGSKARVVRKIMDIIGDAQPRDGYFVDAFTGTGAVAAVAAERGWSVRVNDSLRCATVLAGAQVTPRSEVPFTKLGGYESAVAGLNSATSREGFIWREYSPASRNYIEVERRYFTEANAKRIDGIRAQIASWAEGGVIGAAEERLLLADLLMAVNRAASIAGTYGCFLREFASNALPALELVPRALMGRATQVELYCGDVYDVPSGPDDVVYYDPPYTKRQYAAYYHILETVTIGDEPVVEGVTGLRPWKSRASVFCYKNKALGALVDLIDSTDARRIFLSYSNEGHIALDDLYPKLADLGRVVVHDLSEIGRYRPNQQASDNRATVREFLVEVDKAGTPSLSLSAPMPIGVPAKRERVSVGSPR